MVGVCFVNTGFYCFRVGCTIDYVLTGFELDCYFIYGYITGAFADPIKTAWPVIGSFLDIKSIWACSLNGI